ncbi:MAG: IS481 family transposase, partial [Actinomyces bowdenii]|nr:IS481 family transposase [Actinomyces bowdenii]
MTSFCAEHGLSRNTFYKLRRRAEQMGQAAVLEPLSRRPRTSPTALGEQIKDQAAAVRASLASSGLDHGPVSVHDKMKQMGLEAPSPAWLARLFRERGLARIEPSKKPRAAWRRFVYPAPNACWQMDATAYVLAGGRTCVIFQLIDDHSRLALASLAAQGQTSTAAIATFDTAMARYGVPQRLLTDNGAALGPTRRGRRGALVEHIRALGVEPITGKPYKPTTQGKNERFHSTLLRYLDAQPLAESIEALQAQVDTFDRIYNNERPHQGLPGHITPAQAWAATPIAAPPRPSTASDEPLIPGATPTTRKPPPRSRIPQRGQRRSRIQANGTARLKSIVFLVSTAHAGYEVEITWDPETIVFTIPGGQVLAQYNWPAPGITYVAARGGRARGGPGRGRGATS